MWNNFGMKLIESLENYRVERGLSKADMARKFDVALQNYNNWVYRSSLPKEHMPLAQALISETPESNNATELLRKPDLVPLISWVQAGAFCESPDLFSSGDAEEWLPCPSRHSKGTYALRVKNDSMTSLSHGERSYPHGTIIFVDPERAHTVGSRVVARLPGSSETTFKVYTEDAGQPYLMPINPKYPSIAIPEGTAICGVVIGSYWPE